MDAGRKLSRKRSLSADRALTKKVRAELAEETRKAEISARNKGNYKARTSKQPAVARLGTVEAAKTKRKAAKAATNRAQYKAYQVCAVAHVDTSYNASRYACRHCKQEGHGDVICLASCPLYCSYCRVLGHAFEACAVRNNDAQNNSKRNKDAKAYKRAIDETMVFHSCGICDREYGLQMMHEIEPVRARIAFSGIPRLFEELVAPLADPAATRGARAFAAAAKSELDGGVRRDASYVCAECCKQLPQSDSATASHVVPKLALVNGYFRGACPPELEGLSLVDMSLICPINIISTLSMFDHGHYQSSATVFSVMNDVVDIAPKLPRSTNVGVVCTVIRPGSVQSPKPLRYNPYRVLKALEWLKANNDLYAHINIEPIDDHAEACTARAEAPATTGAATAEAVIPTAGTGVWRNGGMDADCELPFISANSEDYEGITEASLESPAGDNGHPVNPGAPSSDTENMLLYKTEPLDTRQALAAIASPNSAPAVVLVRHNGEYVTDYNTEHFLQRAFPHLFPYGRGGPGSSPALTFGPSYIANMLLHGRCRSFQQCPRFIFYAYTWVMRKKVGTIAHLAEKRGQHGVTAFTVADAKQLLFDLRTTDDPHAPANMSKAKLWSIVRKLQPYAQTVPGTELYFAQERRKLMAMISSPATTTLGQWSWFFTEAQADKYLAEIYDNAVTSFPATRAATVDLAWPARQAYCSKLSAELREQSRSFTLYKGSDHF